MCQTNGAKQENRRLFVTIEFFLCVRFCKPNSCVKGCWDYPLKKKESVVRHNTKTSQFHEALVCVMFGCLRGGDFSVVMGLLPQSIWNLVIVTGGLWDWVNHEKQQSTRDKNEDSVAL